MSDTAQFTNQQPTPPAQNDGIIAKKGASRPLTPSGTHLARCIQMILIGTIEVEFKGNKSMQQKVRIAWELPNVRRKYKEEDTEDKPTVVSEEFTLSLSPKASLRKMIDQWRGKALSEKEADEFDITVLLGKPCSLTLVHVQGKKDPSKTYEKIAAVTGLVKGTPVPEQENPSFYFNYGSKFDAAFVEKLPDFLKDKIKGSTEWKQLEAQGLTVVKTEVATTEHAAATALAQSQEENGDDLPF